MKRPTLDATTLKRGDPLPGYQKTFSTVDLVAYGAATWDWHRLHYDQEYARAKKLPNVIIDGQMYGALFARQALDWAGPRGIVTRMSIRMRAMAFAGDTLHGEGEVSEVRAGGDHHIAVVAQRLLKAEQVAAECTTEVRLPR